MLSNRDISFGQIVCFPVSLWIDWKRRFSDIVSNRAVFAPLSRFRVDISYQFASFGQMVVQQAEPQLRTSSDTQFHRPAVDDGQHLWRIAKDSQTLDLNSSYTYLLWCRDFAETTIMATIDDQPVGFISAYFRPDDPETLLVWQVAVDSDYRGRRLAASMLDALANRVEGAKWLETTITDDNEASMRLFQSFAERRDATLERDPLFEGEHFPDDHDTEYLFRIGPLS